ncbi:RNA 2',3'-cyclic phosphodiesterase [Sphingomicrobium nitratireducens]|uniref:RNA 2',3'-cyclic phosphodiesterase n=1 Tax=Sphingomicrobium nitratireducens TaxID=2964666 RepID=UPI002240C32C|nr:RNA 2',3'-cyclic phosphodiesterase [Sphingomicrobium nitratireducens]
MHRLFVALPLPPALVDALLDAMDGDPEGLRWVPEEQLHCTLRFIGPVERPLANEIADALAGCVVPSPTIAVDGVGIFDHRRHGALWARIVPKAALQPLHAKLDRMLVRLGLEPERRAFLPHVTLARWSGGAIDARGWAARHAGLTCAPVTVDRFTLFESRLGRHGPSYEAIREIRFVSAS